MSNTNSHNFLKLELPLLLLVMLPMLCLFFMWKDLRYMLPIHWSVDGAPDIYAPKYLMGMVNLGVYALLLLLPEFDNRKLDYSDFSSLYFRMRIFITSSISLVYALTLTKSLGYDLGMLQIIHISIILLLMILGYYGKLIRKHWFKIMNPREVNNSPLCNTTYKITSGVWLFSGMGLLIINLIADARLYNFIFIGMSLSVVLFPKVYAYITSKLYKPFNKTYS